jgi:tRNA A-37 threonylcarbamoyl transferase component Bud32
MAETIETLGKYEIKRTLGKGAMGVVYEGWDPIIARRVAIKTVRIPDANDDPETEEALARFRREAQAAGRLTHPNIVGVFDYGETGDIAYIVMEYVDGPSVKSLVDKQERFAIGDTMRIMTDLLNGLQFSHVRGVVHRDVKPANVMLTSEGQAKIADFGIARIESSSMTQAGTVLGTPAYMSPEQFMGQVVDARSDIYSSGVLLYQLLTGERPFEGGMSAIMHKALNTDPPLPSQITVTCPPAFDGVVRKAMAKRPEERFQSAAAFLEALQAAASGRPAMGSVQDDTDADATMVATPGSRAAAAPVGQAARAARLAAGPAAPRSVAEPPAAPVAAAKRSALPMIAAAAVVVLLLLGGGAWFFLLRGPAPAPVAQNAAAAAPGASATGSPGAGPSGAASSGAASSNAASSNSASSGAAPSNAASSNAASSNAAPSNSAPSGAAPSNTASPTPVPAESTAPAPAPTPVQTAVAPIPSQPPPAAPATQSTPPAPSPQLASAGLDIIRQQVAQLAAAQHCSLVDGAVRDGGNIMLDGLAGPSAADALRQALGGVTIPGAVDWRVNSVDPVFCPALNTLHPIVPVFGAVGPRLGLTLADGKTRLSDGDQVLPRLVMPNFRGSLVVDYLAHDGTIQHLYPQLADPKNQPPLTADPPRVFQAGEAVKLGDPRPGHPGWVAGSPYGTDMIIAIASSRPLFNRPRPGNVETGPDYMRDLQAAVDAARRSGEQLAGSALTLDTIEK